MAPRVDADELPQKLGAVMAADPRYQALVALGEPDPPPAPRCETCRDAGYLRRDVAAGHPDFGKLVPCACKRPALAAARLDRFWRSSQAPAKYAHSTLGTYPGEASVVAFLREWLDGERWLILAGEWGAGKTGLTVAVLRELHERGQSALFVNAPAMLRRVRATYRKDAEVGESEGEVVDSLAEVDVLGIDDVGKERLSQWGSELMYDVVNRRYAANRRTIVTTNLDEARLAVHLGAATCWRLIELSDWLTLKGNLRNRNRQRRSS